MFIKPQDVIYDSYIKSFETVSDTLLNTDFLTRAAMLGDCLSGMIPSLQTRVEQLSFLSNLESLYSLSKKAINVFKPLVTSTKKTESSNTTKTETTQPPLKKKTWQETAANVLFTANTVMKSTNFLHSMNVINIASLSKGLISVTTVGSLTFVPFALIKDAILTVGCLFDTYNNVRAYRKIEVLIASKTESEAKEKAKETAQTTDTASKTKTDSPEAKENISKNDLQHLRRNFLMAIVDDIAIIALIVLPYIGALFSVVALGVTAPISLQLTFFVAIVGIAKIGYNIYNAKALSNAANAL